jgi:hypothetical protein
MIEIRYAENELEISGAVEELQEVRQKILTFLKSGDSSLTIAANPNFDPHPYAFAIPQLVIEKGQYPVLVSVVNDRLIIKGSLESLEVFESYFDFAPDAKNGSHAHYEYYEGHEWIAEDSIPLAICIK